MVWMTKQLTFVDFFSGIGGFRIGLERASKHFKTIWSNQWEPSTKRQDASIIYCRQFGADGHSNEDKLLYSCYKRSLEILIEHNLRTIAFPAISTGIYGYPKEEATNIACDAVIDMLKQHGDKIDQVWFVCFGDRDYEIYKRVLKIKLDIN